MHQIDCVICNILCAESTHVDAGIQMPSFTFLVLVITAFISIECTGKVLTNFSV